MANLKKNECICPADKDANRYRAWFVHLHECPRNIFNIVPSFTVDRVQPLAASCDVCGSLVRDLERHVDWHRQLGSRL